MLAGTPIEDYGRWVFYPWSGQLVHVLGPDEYRELGELEPGARLDESTLGSSAVAVAATSVVLRAPPQEG